MKHAASVHNRTSKVTSSPVAPTQSEEPSGPPSALDAYVARIAPEILAVSSWFDPSAHPKVESVTFRFTGRRLGVTGKPRPGDQFVHEEAVGGIVAGGGPVAITARIHGVNAGQWMVESKLTPKRTEADRRRAGPDKRPVPPPVHPAAWSWRKWALSTAPTGPVKTRAAPYCRLPGVIVGSWAAMVVTGVVVALVTQRWIISSQHFRVPHALLVSLLAIVAGVIGAKVWFAFLHRGARRREGWSIQGMVAGVAVVAPVALAIMRTPVGVFLDASAPGLMFGLAVGRLGCFFTGCCAGRPTASRWGVWSSNRRVGVRRIPTQLMESALALSVGVAALIAAVVGSLRTGLLFVVAVAAYTLGRQGILRLREERRQSKFGGLVTAGAAALVLVFAGVLLAASRFY